MEPARARCSRAVAAGARGAGESGAGVAGGAGWAGVQPLVSGLAAGAHADASACCAMSRSRWATADSAEVRAAAAGVGRGRDAVLAEAADWALRNGLAAEPARVVQQTSQTGRIAQSDERTMACHEHSGGGRRSCQPPLCGRARCPCRVQWHWDQVVALGRYMAKTEVHTYAFSVAAQVILSLFPFIVLLLTLSQKVFHSAKMADVVGDMMTNFLPTNQDFVMRNMRALAHRMRGRGVLARHAADHDDGRISPAGSRAEQRVGRDEEPLLPAQPGGVDRAGAAVWRCWRWPRWR